jgi:hypothetical protein
MTSVRERTVELLTERLKAREMGKRGRHVSVTSSCA